MIKDGIIIHNARDLSFWNWQLESEELNAVMVGLLATTLAYQLTATCYNVRFGTKERGSAKASDIQSFMLIEYSSPLMMLAAVIRHGVFGIIRFSGDLPLKVKIASRRGKVRNRATFSLMALLSAAPLFNLTSIFIAMQRDEMVTVNEAKSFSVAVGVDNQVPDIEVLKCKFWRTRTTCDRIPSYVLGPATSLLKFSRCFDLHIPFRVTLKGDKIRIIAELTNLGQIKVSMISILLNIPVSAAIHVDMSSEGKLFRIQPVLRIKEAAKLVHTGQKKLSEFCELAKPQNSPHDEHALHVESLNSLLRVSKDFSCNLTSVNAFADVVLSMTHVNIIEHGPGLKVVNVASIRSETRSATQYFNAGRTPALTRRNRNVNLLPLLLITFFSLILRIVTSWVCNNDIDEGVEAIVRHKLAVHPEQSLLKSSRTVRYESMPQDGGTAHCGLHEEHNNMT